MGLTNMLCEYDYPMCPALGMGLANVPREWDYPMYPGNGTSQCAQ